MPDQTIHVALRDEGVDVWRPVRCEQHTDGTYQLLDDSPDDETWEFPPGSRVHGEWRELEGDRVLVATRRADQPD